ncbi:MAG: inositol monophosphatase [Nanoarchaeota archaeon]|nr:inositol monophosphatase [Nanoarchaeota archaeon]
MGQSEDINLKQTKQFMIEIAKEAGDMAKSKFGKVKDYKRKEEKTQLVSEVDFAAEKIIKSRILERFPDHAILAEESADSGEAEKDSEYLWIIDPIDGTRNFLHGHPSFGVSIALAKNRKVVLGVVYFPMYDWVFSAEKGNGAEKNGEKIHVSDRSLKDGSDLLGNFGCDFHKEKDEQVKVLSNLIEFVKKVRIEGSATFGFCMVADGVYDCYIQRFIKPWDFAASCLIIEEAGGKVTDYQGNPWNIDMGGKILSSNGKFHGKLIEIVK